MKGRNKAWLCKGKNQSGQPCGNYAKVGKYCVKCWNEKLRGEDGKKSKTN